MNRGKGSQLGHMLVLTLLAMPAGFLGAQATSAVTVDPSIMTKLGTVDPRYLSYNIDIV